MASECVIFNLMDGGKEIDNNYLLTLKEKNGNKGIQMIIGFLDAQAMAIELENTKTIRPLTHDLVKEILDNHKIKVKNIEISHAEDNIFYAYIYFSTGKVISARPSDAIIFALKCKAPIMVSDGLFDEFGTIITINDEEKLLPPPEKTELEKYEIALKKSIDSEDFEAAKILKEKIEKLKKKK